MGRFSFALCRPTGEPVAVDLEAQQRVLAFVGNGVDNARIAIPLDSAAAGEVLPGRSRLKVWRRPSEAELDADPDAEAELVFYGVLPAEGYQASGEANLLTLSFQSPLGVLADRTTLGPTVETYNGYDQGFLLWDIVDKQNQRPGGDTWLRFGESTTGVPRTRTYDRQSAWGVLEEMARLVNGPDFWVDYRDGWAEGGSRVMGDFRVALSRGQVRTNVHFAYGRGLPANCADATLTYQKVITLVERAGTDAATGAEISASAGAGSAAQALFGIVEDYASSGDATTLQRLQEEASGLFYSRSRLRPVFTVQPTSEAPRALEHYRVGDTVRVSFRKGSVDLVNQPVRIDGITITIDAAGGETVQPMLAGPDDA